MKKRIFIIHGWGGSPEGNWFPWLKNELKKNGIEATIPQMPNADFPKQEEWIEHLKEVIGKVDENTTLVGHSLGVIAILRFLETLSEEEKIGKALLVAGFSENVGISEIESFFKDKVNFGKIKKSAKEIVVINSNDDPYVPVEEGKILRDNLDAKFILLKKQGHIQTFNGKFELPIVLEEILTIAQ